MSDEATTDTNDTTETETETVTHWGCQYVRTDGKVYITRWDPGYGSGMYIPYTEAQARADVATPDRDWPGSKRLVKRTQTTVVTTTAWEPVEDGAGE
jgi:hypothetical protein